MRFVCISDTHCQHMAINFNLPEADGIIFAGDFANNGELHDCAKGLHWLNALPYKYRIVIAGNHDVFMDKNHPRAILSGSNQSMLDSTLPVSEGFHYLQNSGVEIEGVKIWGSPYTPNFYEWRWGFNLGRGAPLRQNWDQIPSDTDILVTHGPAYGILDGCPDYEYSSDGSLIHVGDKDLLDALKRVKPKAHVFGHVHYSYGAKIVNGRICINASVCNEDYDPVNKPFAIDIVDGNYKLINYL